MEGKNLAEQEAKKKIVCPLTFTAILLRVTQRVIEMFPNEFLEEHTKVHNQKS